MLSLTLAKLLRRLDANLRTRLIPVTHFGWEELRPGVGRWHFSLPERERFYEHNRRLDRMAGKLRQCAADLEKRPNVGKKVT